MYSCRKKGIAAVLGFKLRLKERELTCRTSLWFMCSEKLPASTFSSIVTSQNNVRSQPDLEQREKQAGKSESGSIVFVHIAHLPFWLKEIASPRKRGPFQNWK